MVATVAAYILAILVMLLAASVLGAIIQLPLVPLVRKRKSLAPASTFLSSAISMVVALLAFAWICGQMDVQPTLLMFLLPFFGVVSNDFDRIKRARMGATPVRAMLAKHGDGYDAAFQVKMEYGYLIGDVLGVLLTLLVLRPLPLY